MENCEKWEHLENNIPNTNLARALPTPSLRTVRNVRTWRTQLQLTHGSASKS